CCEVIRCGGGLLTLRVSHQTASANSRCGLRHGDVCARSGLRNAPRLLVLRTRHGLRSSTFRKRTVRAPRANRSRRAFTIAATRTGPQSEPEAQRLRRAAGTVVTGNASHDHRSTDELDKFNTP